MYIQQLKNEVDALKKEVRKLKALGEAADNVLVATVEELDRRVTEIEHFIGKGEAGN